MTSNEFDSVKTPDTTVFRRWFFILAFFETPLFCSLVVLVPCGHFAYLLFA